MSGTPTSRTPMQIVGMVETPSMLSDPLHGRQLSVAGWMVHSSGIEQIRLRCDGLAAPDALLGGPRQEVAAVFPDMPGAARAGFAGSVDISRLAAGVHELQVIARACNGREDTWILPFSVRGSSEVYADWRDLNRPLPGSPVHRMLSVWASVDLPSVGIVVDAADADAAALARTLDALAQQHVAAARVQVVHTLADPQSVLQALLTLDTDLVGWVRAGDVCAPHALAVLAGNFARLARCDLLYADHDQSAADGAASPRFKPSWSPCLLADHDYIGRCWLARATLVRQVLPHSGEAASQGADRANRHWLQALGDKARAVGHVPTVLLSQSSDSPADVTQDATMPVQGPRPIATLQAGQRRDEEQERVSVIIPTRASDPGLLSRCLDSLFGVTAHPGIEVIVLPNNVDDWDATHALLQRWPVHVHRWNSDFNWSGINNLGAQVATGNRLLFLNDDVVAQDDRWLGEMLALARQPGVGAVGALLDYPNGQLQHGGVWLPWKKRFAGRHAFRFCTGGEAGLEAWLRSNREQSAVTGACLLVRRECHEAVGGFDESLPLVFNDVDYCLRLGRIGHRSVIAGRARLHHHEGVSRAGMREERDAERFMARWAGHLPAVDAYSHPCLSPGRDDWVLDPLAVGPIEARVITTVSAGLPDAEPLP